MKILFLSVAIALVLYGESRAGTFEDGVAAFQRGDYAVAWENYIKAAKRGNVKAQINLGAMYDNGQGVSQNHKEAVKWYKLAATKGSVVAQFNLGAMYYAGLGVAQNYGEAVKWFRLAAAQGDEQAAKWLKKASIKKLGKVEGKAGGAKKSATNKNKKIMVFPGQKVGLNEKSAAYRKGIAAFNRRDFKTALRIFQPIAEKGDVDAQVNIGMMYLKGWDVEQDFKEAIKWFLLAADQDFPAAQQNMGLMYMEGLGVEKNHTEAANWYRLAAEKGDMMSQYNIGVMLRDGTGVKKDLNEAVKWLAKAAEQKHVAANFNLGVLYRDGTGVKQDYAKAAKYYGPIAEFGFSPAQFDLGLLYFKGNGVDKNYEKAEKWFRKAAKQGDNKAQYNLGVMYLYGTGLAKNLELATQWIEKASRNGHPSAQKVLKQLKAGLSPLTPEQAKIHKANINNCLIKPTDEPDVRINACTWLLNSGKLVKEGIPFAFSSRSISYKQKGQYDLAIADLDQAMRFKPNFADAYNTLAWLLATAKEAHYRDGKRAVELVQKALSLKDKVEYRDTLSAAYAEVGRFDDAMVEQERAIATLRTNGKKAAAADFQSRLDLYKKRLPYRE